MLVYLPWRKKENLLKDGYKQSSAACGAVVLLPIHSSAPALLFKVHPSLSKI